LSGIVADYDAGPVTTAPPTGSTHPPRRDGLSSIVALLRIGVFRAALGARFTSNAGSWMQTVAASWVVFQLTHSAAAVGALALTSRGPALLLSGWGGLLADRVDRRQLAIWLSIVQAVLALGLAGAAWADGLSVALVFALSLGIGAAGAIATPALQTTIPSLVPDAIRADAVALNASTYNLARLIGPAIGGGVLAAAGSGACFAVNALSFTAVVVLMRHVPLSQKTHVRRSLREAMDYAVGEPTIRDLIIAVTLFLVFASSVQRLAVVIADGSGTGAQGQGLLLSALAAGGLIGTAATVRLQDRRAARSRMLSIAVAVFALAMAAIAPDLPFALTLAAVVLAGACWEVVWVVSMAGVQLSAADGREGEAIGLYLQATSGAQAIGPLAVGLAVDAVGLMTGLLACAAVLGVLASVGLTGARAALDREPVIEPDPVPAPAA
jgi:MFS family permease